MDVYYEGIKITQKSVFNIEGLVVLGAWTPDI